MIQVARSRPRLGRSRLAAFVALLAALVALLPGCGGMVDAPGDVAVRDSAGVRIVESHVEREALPVFAEVGPMDLSIGVVEGPGEYTFGRVTDVAGGPDGSIVVVEFQDRTFRVYDAGGRYVRSLGGRGGGPGEFVVNQLARVDRSGIHAYDPATQRITRFGPEGALGEVLTFTQEASGRPTEVRRLGDGTYVARSTLRRAAPAAGPPEVHDLEVVHDSLVLRHLDERGADLDTIALLPADDVLRQTRSPTAGRFESVASPRPFGARTFWVADESGGVTTLRSTSLELRTYGPSGSLRQIARMPDAARPLDWAEVARLKDRRMEEAGERAYARTLAEESFAPELLPEEMPLASDLELDPDGNFWIGTFATFEEEATEWIVFAPTGEVLGRTTLPPGLRVDDIGRDYVLGVETDAMEVQYVRRYPFPRSGGG